MHRGEVLCLCDVISAQNPEGKERPSGDGQGASGQE